MARTFDIDVTCPYCGRPNQAHTRAAGEGQPDTGAVGICYSCGEPAIFEVGVFGTILRKPTPEEAAELRADENIQQLIAAWRDNVKGKPRGLRADPMELARIGRQRTLP